MTVTVSGHDVSALVNALEVARRAMDTGERHLFGDLSTRQCEDISCLMSRIFDETRGNPDEGSTPAVYSWLAKQVTLMAEAGATSIVADIGGGAYSIRIARRDSK